MNKEKGKVKSKTICDGCFYRSEHRCDGTESIRIEGERINVACECEKCRL